MAGEAVLVTGGTGFIGAHCILQCTQMPRGCQTTTLTSLPLTTITLRGGLPSIQR